MEGIESLSGMCGEEHGGNKYDSYFLAFLTRWRLVPFTEKWKLKEDTICGGDHVISCGYIK